MTTLTKTFSNRNLAGNYNETSVDVKKSVSNRLVSICGKYYTIISKTNEMIELVGKRAFDKWARNNEYVTDF